jgi:hypothetical protein
LSLVVIHFNILDVGARTKRLLEIDGYEIGNQNWPNLKIKKPKLEPPLIFKN